MKKGTIGKIFAYIGNYKFLMLVSALMASVSVFATLYIPVVTGRGVDCIAGPGDVDFEGLFSVMARIMLLTFASAAAQWIMSMVNNRVTYHVVADIRKDAFGKIQDLPVAYIDEHPAGELLSRVITDVDQFADGLLMGFTQAFTGALTIAATLVIMFYINVPIAVIIVGLTPLSMLWAAVIAKKSHARFRAQSEARAAQTAFINEMTGGARLVSAFGYEDRAFGRFNVLNEELRRISLKAIFISAVNFPATRFINALIYALVAVAGARYVLAGGITVGILTSLLAYAHQYEKPFNEISGVVTELQNALACAERIFALIGEQPQTPDPEEPASLEGIKGEAELDRVCFSYDKSRPVLKDICMEARAGQRIALVGPTGCGKTTLINLLMRFYDADSGDIRLDGVSVYDASRGALRENFGMVLQDTWLKTGTIRDNIRMGRPGASDEEVKQAAKACHAHSFIKRLPEGYDTVIGENGGSLSQGQKQLICIARVMLALPPMLILDEATSSIDTRTELKVQDAFAAMMKGRTSFIVAHRLSTIKNADLILVMNEGQIIERGRHEELLERGGFYAKLYNSQFTEA